MTDRSIQCPDCWATHDCLTKVHDDGTTSSGAVPKEGERNYGICIRCKCMYLLSADWKTRHLTKEEAADLIEEAKSDHTLAVMLTESHFGGSHRNN